MKTLHSCSFFRSAPVRGWKRGRTGKLGTICAVVLLLWAATAITASAQTFTSLLSFDNTNGSGPGGTLVQGIDGNLYGTTGGGGAYGDGTVFKVTRAGQLTTVYSFCAQTNCTDGSPYLAGLVLATDGNLYGTTYLGGANNAGTVFKITPGGTLTTLYSFCSQTSCTDGADPFAGLIQGTDGSFYGTTEYGGACGTVFRITPAGALTMLYSFSGTDGQSPTGTLVQASDGNFYGTTAGGSGACPENAGTVFKITPAGELTTLYSFDGNDGALPIGGLVQADGYLYGTTSELDSGLLTGTVFKISPAGRLTTLVSFNRPRAAWPWAGLVLATDGNLYGTTSGGGAYGGGTIFKITPSGASTPLYNFCAQTGCTDGAGPVAGLVQATDGNLYGTTAGGGAYGYGTVFTLSMGLGPFVETLPTSGKVGRAVVILGNNLTGSTSVTFNGTPATFTVVPTGTAIKTTVPSDASTGPVQVVTPSGTLTSNANFWVKP
jgi:uncharacterized repeat protein (TIGR03803 family)